MLSELDLWTASTVLGPYAAGCEVIRKQVWGSPAGVSKGGFQPVLPCYPEYGGTDVRHGNSRGGC